MKIGDTVRCIKDYNEKDYFLPRNPKKGDIDKIVRFDGVFGIHLKYFHSTSKTFGGFHRHWWEVVDSPKKVDINIKIPHIK